MKNKRLKIQRIQVLLSMLCLVAMFGKTVGQNITTPPSVPSAHPRLFIMPDQVQQIKSKINRPEFYVAKNAVYNSSAPACIAFKYLMEKNASDGKNAINSAYNALRGVKDYGKNRAPFKAVFNASVAFDYCYDLFGTGGVPSKAAFISELERVISLGPGSGSWAPVKMSLPTIVGHFVEGVFYNQVLAGIALHGDNNKYYDAAAEFIIQRIQPENSFWFASHMHHQGAYIGTRFSHIVLAALAFNTLTGGKDIFSDDMQYVPYQLIYTLRPDKQLMRIGDVSDDAGVFDYNNFVIQQVANYYDDPYLYWLADQGIFKDYNKELESYFFELIYRPASVNKAPIDQLPLTRYFAEPVGGDMIARTGWNLNANSDDAVVHMRVGNYYFGNHQHKDFGTFQIYYRGNLTGDAGMYGGSKSGASSDFWENYYRSSSAHNSLLIIDPREKYSGGSWTNTKVDGGIRWPYNNDVQPDNLDELLKPGNGYEMAQVTGHDFGPDPMKPEWSFLSGDLTKGYNYANGLNKNKVDKVIRSMVTLNTKNQDYPCIFMVFDRIDATSENFQKVFLLHSMQKASVSGNKVTVVRENATGGKLVSHTLLPEQPSYKVASGYTVGGTTYDPGTKGNRRYEKMDWRVEISPSVPSKKDEFFHVMTVTDGNKSTPDPEKIMNESLIGAKLLDRVTLFNREGGFMAAANFQIQGNGVFKTLICDLSPGKWLVEKDGAELGVFEVASKERTLYFEGSDGYYKITHLESGTFVIQR